MALTPCTIIDLPKLQNPTGQDARQLAEKLRELRLVALKTAPESFASSYDVEVEAGLEKTLERLNNPQARQFVALQGTPDHNDTFANLFQARWVGMIVLIGPVAVQISAQSDPLYQATSAVNSGRYHLNGVFVDPGLRHVGVGRALIAAALDKGKTESRFRGEDFRCTIMVDSENTAAKTLYKSFGFRVIGTETYFQQARSCSHHVAERVAMVMELYVMHGDGTSSL